MDTPEKNQIATPTSKFEDSPVFSYINSLSPIRPVKSIHTTQTFNSPTFASPPSVFTSPHINSHGESRFFKWNHLTDPSKSEFSERGNEDSKNDTISDSVQLSDLCAEKLGCLGTGNSAREITTRTLNEHSELAVELRKALRCDCGSPDINTLPHDVIKTESVREMVGTPASIVQFTRNGAKQSNSSLGSEIVLGEICQIEQNKEAAGCDWEKLMLDAADLLISDLSIIDESSEGQDHQSVESGTTSCTSTALQLPEDNINELQKTQSIGPVSCKKHDMKVHVVQSGEVAKLKETVQAPEFHSSTLLIKQITSDSNAEVDDKCIHPSSKPVLQQQRSIRRLVFEISGVHKKRSIYNHNSSSSVSSLPECELAFNEKQKVSINPADGYSSSMLPIIGLHLNALASSSNNVSLAKDNTLAFGGQLISIPSSNSSFDSLTSGPKPLDISLDQNCIERDLGPCDNGVQIPEDATSSFGVNEEFSQSSPRKKRQKSEYSGESEVCKRCNCKKSKCLKLYCECFAAGLYCVEPCSCQDCFNKPMHEDTVLETRKQIESRNPLAFAPKVIRSSESVSEFGDECNKTPASARHKRGCNCKKSSCLKKYCECFQGGVGCSISCRCEGCKNVFGRKNGTEESELQGEEAETCEKNAFDVGLENNVVQEDKQEHPHRILPITPSSEIGRPLVQLPFSFSGKPPRSSLLALGSSPQLCTSHKLKKSDFLCHLPKRLQMIPEDETPEILKGNCSPTSGVKSASPNCKRVSPPHRESASSPARRTSRKLILRSIPLFPSLAPHDNNNSSGKIA